MTRFRADYNDGESAALHKAEVTCTPLGILIETTERTLLAEWDWADVGLAEPIAEDRPIRLLNRSSEGARLTIADHAALPIFEQNAPTFKRAPVSRQNKRRFVVIGAVLASFTLFVVYGLPRLAGPLAKTIPMQWEEEVGGGVVDAVTGLFGAQGEFCNAPAGAAALDRLTRKLSATVTTPYRFKVRVAKSKTVNAFAAPGGHVVLLSALIDKAESPDEVAGVLAHEMGHVTLRHPTKALIHAYGWSMLLTALTGFSGDLVSTFALHLATSSYSRANESEADDAAIEMLTRAGIGSDGFVAFFKKLQAKSDTGESDLLKYLATHPALQKRIDAVKAKSAPAQSPALSEADWISLRAICG